jgi:hypothetical protein
MHGKDLVMRPLIKQFLQINTSPAGDFNTDEFGTFSGEVERPFDPITTLRMKILKGLQLSGETLGIGSEGSFGPHPQLHFVPADQEIVMMIDLEHQLEIVEVVTSTDTNFAHAEIHSVKDLIDFANQVHFTSHGLILKKSMDGKVMSMEKGIVTWDHLQMVFMRFKKQSDLIIAETDMRAFLNPSRMRVIESATERLMKKILRACPMCQWPGFGETQTKPGLPCSWCGAPTRLTQSTLCRCSHCNYVEEKLSADDHAEPQFCDHCNP